MPKEVQRNNKSKQQQFINLMVGILKFFWQHKRVIFLLMLAISMPVVTVMSTGRKNNDVNNYEFDDEVDNYELMIQAQSQLTTEAITQDFLLPAESVTADIIFSKNNVEQAQQTTEDELVAALASQNYDLIKKIILQRYNAGDRSEENCALIILNAFRNNFISVNSITNEIYEKCFKILKTARSPNKYVVYAYSIMQLPNYNYLVNSDITLDIVIINEYIQNRIKFWQYLSTFKKENPQIVATFYNYDFLTLGARNFINKIIVLGFREQASELMTECFLFAPVDSFPNYTAILARYYNLNKQLNKQDACANLLKQLHVTAPDNEAILAMLVLSHHELENSHEINEYSQKLSKLRQFSIYLSYQALAISEMVTACFSKIFSDKSLSDLKNFLNSRQAKDSNSIFLLPEQIMLVISDANRYLEVIKEARSWFEIGIEHFKSLNNQFEKDALIQSLKNFEKEQDTIIKEIIFILELDLPVFNKEVLRANYVAKKLKNFLDNPDNINLEIIETSKNSYEKFTKFHVSKIIAFLLTILSAAGLYLLRKKMPYEQPQILKQATTQEKIKFLVEYLSILSGVIIDNQWSVSKKGEIILLTLELDKFKTLDTEFGEIKLEINNSNRKMALDKLIALLDKFEAKLVNKVISIIYHSKMPAVKANKAIESADQFKQFIVINSAEYRARQQQEEAEKQLFLYKKIELKQAINVAEQNLKQVEDHFEQLTDPITIALVRDVIVQVNNSSLIKRYYNDVTLQKLQEELVSFVKTEFLPCSNKVLGELESFNFQAINLAPASFIGLKSELANYAESINSIENDAELNTLKIATSDLLFKIKFYIDNIFKFTINEINKFEKLRKDFQIKLDMLEKKKAKIDKKHLSSFKNIAGHDKSKVAESSALGDEKIKEKTPVYLPLPTKYLIAHSPTKISLLSEKVIETKATQPVYTLAEVEVKQAKVKNNPYYLAVDEAKESFEILLASYKQYKTNKSQCDLYQICQQIAFKAEKLNEIADGDALYNFIISAALAYSVMRGCDASRLFLYFKKLINKEQLEQLGNPRHALMHYLMLDAHQFEHIITLAQICKTNVVNLFEKLDKQIERGILKTGFFIVKYSDISSQIEDLIKAVNNNFIKELLDVELDDLTAIGSQILRFGSILSMCIKLSESALNHSSEINLAIDYLIARLGELFDRLRLTNKTIYHELIGILNEKLQGLENTILATLTSYVVRPGKASDNKCVTVYECCRYTIAHDFKVFGNQTDEFPIVQIRNNEQRGKAIFATTLIFGDAGANNLTEEFINVVNQYKPNNTNYLYKP